jgi:hypothetical protein
VFCGCRTIQKLCSDKSGEYEHIQDECSCIFSVWTVNFLSRAARIEVLGVGPFMKRCVLSWKRASPESLLCSQKPAVGSCAEIMESSSSLLHTLLL